MTGINEKVEDRRKFTTTLDDEAIKKLGIMAAMLNMNKNDVIELLVNEVKVEEWIKRHEVEKKRRNL